MNIIQFFRTPNLSIILALLILFVSCERYEVINKSFDYSIYNAYKDGSANLFIVDNNNIKSLNDYKELLTDINNHYNTELEIPNDLIQSFLLKNKNTFSEISLEKGWLNQDDINLNNDLIENITSIGYESAIDIFKNQTLALNLSEEEFSKKNLFINILEIIQNENPNLFDMSSQEKSWACAYATITWLAAVASVASCATVVLCGLAIFGAIQASNHFVNTCNPPQQ